MNRRRGRVAGTAVGTFVSTFLLVGTLLPVALGLVPGWDARVVTSGSMAPALVPGDVLVSRTSTGGSGVGSIVTYESPRGTVSHRVVDVDRHGRWITRGDANPTADPTPVDPGRALGEGILVLPGIGAPWRWLQEGNLLPLAALGIVLWWSIGQWRPRRRPAPPLLSAS